MRFWQLQWLLVCFVEFVDDDSPETSERGAVIVARGAVVVAWAREGEPADTVVGVERLARPEYLIEVDAIAVIGP